MDVCRAFARRRWGWAVRGAAGLAVASAVSAAAAAPPRAVVLLPPRAGDAAPPPVVARAAADDNPLASTPVARKTGPAPLRPLSPGATPAAAGGAKGLDWLSGVDPNVLQAGGTMSRPPATKPATFPSPKLAPPTDSNPLAKGVDALKGFVAPAAAPPGTPPLTPPAGRPQPPAPSPGDPLQGKAANGAPVLAGPPAWRWYGYGTVTPGANPLAPAGQYPRASANWYEVTRATPGAFPVPVVNPFRTTPGAEPPAYAAAPPAPRPFPTAYPTPADLAGAAPRFTPVPAPAFMPPPVAVAPPSFAPVPVPAAEPPPVMAMPAPVPLVPPQVPVPTLAPIPLPPPVAVTPPAFTPIPLPPPVSLAPDAAPPPARLPEPLTVAPPVEDPVVGPRLAAAPGQLPAIPVAAPVVAPPLPVVSPVAAPAVPDDDTPWRANPDRAAPPPPSGTWLPADRGRPAGGPGAFAAPRGVVARAQAPDEPAAGPAAVVEAVCRGRARNVDVRPAGPRRLTVCFEVRGQPDAAALVRDLSARPELAAYEIDFCVVVR